MRAKVVDSGYGNATIGTLLNFEAAGGSRYPGEIRYGKGLKTYPSDAMARMSEMVCAWVRQHIDDVRFAPQPNRIP